MDTFIIKADGVEVARLTGDGITLGVRSISPTESLPDPKCLKLIRKERSVFVLMASSLPSVTVEKCEEVS